MIKTIKGLSRVTLNLSILTYLDKTYGNPYFSLKGEFKTKNINHDINLKRQYGNNEQYKYELYNYLIKNKLINKQINCTEFIRSLYKDNIFKSLRINTLEVKKIKDLD